MIMTLSIETPYKACVSIKDVNRGEKYISNGKAADADKWALEKDTTTNSSMNGKYDGPSYEVSKKIDSWIGLNEFIEEAIKSWYPTIKLS